MDTDNKTDNKITLEADQPVERQAEKQAELQTDNKAEEQQTDHKAEEQQQEKGQKKEEALAKKRKTFRLGCKKPWLCSLLAIILGILLALLVIILSSSGNILDTLVQNKPLLGERTDSFCALSDYPDNSCLGRTKPLCKKDMEIAKIAWTYFENNYQPTTGLYNSVNQYPSTTMWDTGSALAATIAAEDFGMISSKEFDDRIMAMLKTLKTMEMFNNEAPNKAYNTERGDMVDYNNNKSPDGIGVSTLDLARLVSWLKILSCMHPKHAYQSHKAIDRWDYTRLITNGEMYGLLLDPVSKEIQVLQEGRLGYEQYAGKIFAELGFDQSTAGIYRNQYFRELDIYEVPIAYDSRDPRELGAYNYVVTESYALDVMENGLDAENEPLLNNIYEVQRRRWQRTGITTAVSEDNIDREPWFLYNTIFTAGLPWNTTTDTGVRYDDYKTTSVKAAFSLASLFPDDEYSKVLINQVENAYDPEKGWYSGVFERGLGYNKAMTANTNGIIMSLLLYKKYGTFSTMCNNCQRGIFLDDRHFTAQNSNSKMCEQCVGAEKKELIKLSE